MPRPPGDLQGPSAPSRRGGTDPTKPRAPDGSHIFTVRSIKDIGWVESKFHEDTEDGSGGKPTLRVVIEGGLPDGGTFILARDVTHSYDPRSILCQMGAAILGIDPNDETVELDYKQLVRGRFLGEVKSRTYHPKGDDGNRMEDVTHYFTEWKGAPLALPAELRNGQPAAAPAREAADPGATAQPSNTFIAGSTITKDVWEPIAPKLHKLLYEYFKGSTTDLHAYLTDDNEGHLMGDLQANADVIASWLRVRGPADVVFNFRNRSDADAEDLSMALDLFLALWAEDATAQPEREPDDLPF